MAELEILNGVAEVPREAWNALGQSSSPFLEWDWLASLEEAGTLGPESGWLSRPLVAREAGELVAACPLYVKTNSDGEFVFDWGWADAAQSVGLRYFPKLFVGVPFTPVTGARFLVAPGRDRGAWIERLGVALRDLCLRQSFSSVHVCFCRRDELEALEKLGFLPRMGLQYHWKNTGFGSFEEFLARFRSKRRNQIRRERRALAQAGIELETWVGDAVTPELASQLFELYRRNLSRQIYGRQYLNREFFELLWERMRARLCVVVARRGKKTIAGALNLIQDDALYGRYWGSLEDVRYLHFNVCYYAGIEHCIDRGLPRFEPGAGGEFKRARGFDPEPTWSAHFIADLPLRSAVGRFLTEERRAVERAVDWLRARSALKAAAD
ncbi:MAG: GNAT family N-acetyltransferase [Myxococcota bacterium]